MSAGHRTTRLEASPDQAAQSHASAAANLNCPRCGYDQSGLEQSLQSQCERGEIDAWPLRSRCTECGAEFNWITLFSISRSGAYFFELARRNQWRALTTTIRRMPLPGRFWKWVRTDWSIRPGRMLLVSLIAMVFWVLLVGEVCTALGIGLGQWSLLIDPPTTRQTSGSITSWDPKFPYATGPRATWILSPMAREHRRFGTQPSVAVWCFVSLFAALLAPLALGCFPNRVRSAPRLWAHLLRAWCYGLASLGMVAILAIAGPRLFSGALTLTQVTIVRLGLEVDFGSRAVERLLRLHHGEFIAAAILGFTWYWWTCAFRDYMKLPRSGYLAAAMILISFGVCWLIALQFTAISISVGFPW